LTVVESAYLEEASQAPQVMQIEAASSTTLRVWSTGSWRRVTPPAGICAGQQTINDCSGGYLCSMVTHVIVAL